MAKQTNSFDITGGKEFERKLRAAGPGAIKAAAGSLYRSAERTMGKSKDKYVPIDTGALKSTGTVALPEIKGNTVLVQMGYGGPAAKYAVEVHEQNKAYNGGRQWKYLETPTKEDIPEYERNLVADLNEYLGTLA